MVEVVVIGEEFDCIAEVVVVEDWHWAIAAFGRAGFLPLLLLTKDVDGVL
jgi:hypothetical protein